VRAALVVGGRGRTGAGVAQGASARATSTTGRLWSSSSWAACRWC